jgi:hypothetical protein
MKEIKKLEIDIRPPVSVYGTFRRLTYLPWYAIAEFVDNATQNYFDHKPELDNNSDEKKKKKLTIKIVYDRKNNKLSISDNANGMDFAELKRAIKLDSPPENPSGRCEFGMGLKTAACWFSRKWKIETKRLGETEKYSLVVDVKDMSHQVEEKLSVDAIKTKPKEHYTIITLEEIYKPLSSRTIGRIKLQLASMYRVDLNSKDIEILWNGVRLKSPKQHVLKESQMDGRKTIWKKEISFEVPWKIENQMLSVNGWVGIRDPGSQRDAGFVLFRRGRVIVGGPERGYKPKEIFGQGNTFRSQRLIGELSMDNWPVTQAKDAFDWTGELEEAFIEILKNEAKDYMNKAEKYRSDQKTTKPEIQQVANETKESSKEEEIEAYEEKLNEITKKLSEDRDELETVKQNEETNRHREYAFIIKDRLNNFQTTFNELKQLIKESIEKNVGKEEKIKEKIKKNKWLLGLECDIDAKNQDIDNQGEIDLHIKTKYDEDKIFEIKSPNIKPFIGKRMNSKTKTRLIMSDELADGLSELIFYLERTNLYAELKLQGGYGISKASGFILIGYNLTDDEKTMINYLNFHLSPHIRIITYNDLENNIERELETVKKFAKSSKER